MNDGVDDERDDCTTVDELTGFRESLAELATKFGFDVARHLELLDEAIAEREDDGEKLDGDGMPAIGATRPSVTPTSDDDVRELFRTLLSDDSEDAAQT